MECAPVLVITLNRIDKLKQMIESLQRNPLAKETELYISVDYPPSSRYWNGYPECCEYVKQIDGFRHVHYYIQEENLGPHDNAEFLRNLVGQTNDVWIMTEDDNVFAPNFLEYMNRALRRYENDDNVLWVCAQLPRNVDYSSCEGNIIYSTFMCAWGAGCWRKKKEQIESEIDEVFDSQLGKTLSMQWGLYHHSQEDFYRLAMYIAGKREFRGKDGHIMLLDMTLCLYLFAKNKRCVTSTIPKSRNNGYDGSGVNCQNRRDYVQRVGQTVLDSNEYFDAIRVTPITSKEYGACQQKLYNITRKKKKQIAIAWLILLANDFLPEALRKKVLKQLAKWA